MVGMSNFGECIKEIRLSKKLTLRDVSEKCGISHPYLSQIENGKKNTPKPAMIAKLAKGLDVPYIVLLQKAGILEEDIADGENELFKENIRLNEENRKLREVIKNIQNLISNSFD